MASAHGRLGNFQGRWLVAGHITVNLSPWTPQGRVAEAECSPATLAGTRPSVPLPREAYHRLIGAGRILSYSHFLTCAMALILIEYGAQRNDYPAV
jgi:hypothetical protein